MPVCIGTTKQGARCRKYALAGRHHCEWHGPKCNGKRRDGGKCGSLAQAEFNWVYCCADHTPTLPTSTLPADFRIDNLRGLKTDIVKEYRGGEDVYRNTPLLPRKYYEMDHVVEIHLVRDAYDSVPKQGTGFRKKKESLLASLKESVNATENLAFTTELVNKSKFEAVKSFKEDYRKCRGRQLDEGLFPYLQDALQGTRTWSRSVSRNIQREILDSSDKLLASLQEEDPLHEHVARILTDNFTAMKLN